MYLNSYVGYRVWFKYITDDTTYLLSSNQNWRSSVKGYIMRMQRFYIKMCEVINEYTLEDGDEPAQNIYKEDFRLEVNSLLNITQGVCEKIHFSVIFKLDESKREQFLQSIISILQSKLEKVERLVYDEYEN